MAVLTGKTQDGFTYEAEYETASGGRILWSATFRRDGDYAGVRHGRLPDVPGAEPDAVSVSVKASIESTWTDPT
ncbi:MAG: TonB-dependent receptor [Rhodanobacter sp.]